ncbi:DUF742 domain-containing protein [Streptomyces sp. NPDC001380]|uniref:DUF742 domain-containing protein n=1 Tax=Streptomyces sp. NPDC001380 TaxID=3364566 RepID=UPI003680BEE1
MFPPGPPRGEPPDPSYGPPAGGPYEEPPDPAAPAARPGRPGRPRHPSRWFDDDAGPLVRPYAVTRGRTGSADGAFDLIAQVASEVLPHEDPPVGPEQAAILDLCRSGPLSVAEVAAGLDLPLGVVRVLLADLLDAAYIRVSRPLPPALLPDEHILREVINGLRAL